VKLTLLSVGSSRFARHPAGITILVVALARSLFFLQFREICKHAYVCRTARQLRRDARANGSTPKTRFHLFSRWQHLRFHEEFRAGQLSFTFTFRPDAFRFMMRL